MAKVVICPPAEQEYADALTWYAERNVEAAERFDAEFSDILETIGEFPQRFPRCDERHQFCLMQRFPYQIIYRIKEDCAVVIAVAHTSRKPSYWSSR